MLEGTSGGNLVQSPALAGPPRAEDRVQVAFDYLCSFYFFGLGSLSVYFLCKKYNFVELERENQCLFAYSQGTLFCCS